eukprot:COSAG06_NODE_61443_length_267_cov_1.851190_2_plen_29_part_01
MPAVLDAALLDAAPLMSASNSTGSVAVAS